MTIEEQVGIIKAALKALVAGAQAAMKEAGLDSYRTSGDPASGWIVVDYVDIVLHVFLPEARA